MPLPLTMPIRSFICLVVLASLLRWPATAIGNDAPGVEGKNDVYRLLVEPPQGCPLRLSPARFTTDSSAEAWRLLLQDEAEPRYRVEQLLRPTVVAPHILNMQRERLDEIASIRQHLRVVFGLRGQLDRLADEAFLDALLAAEGDESGDEAVGRSRPLTDDELRLAGIEPPGAGDKAAPGGEYYRLIHGELFSRVRFSGVVRGQWTRTQDAILLAVRFDDAFGDEERLRPTWQRLDRNAAGQLTVSQRGDFLGAGAYVRISRWPEQDDILLCEAEIVMIEPLAWFAGRNLLGSKFPAAIQSQVRAIRRAALQRMR